jgi:hypothetical protein
MQRGGTLTASGEVWLQPNRPVVPSASSWMLESQFRASGSSATQVSSSNSNELAPARFLLRAGFGSDATGHDLSPRRCERRETDLVSRRSIFSTIPQAFRG